MNPVEQGLGAFIAELAKKAYMSKAEGVLLSRVGEQVAKINVLRTELGGRKLAAFIEEELKEQVRIHTSPENHIVKIILPAEVSVGDDIKKYIPTRASTGVSKQSFPRYPRALWAAFSQDLQPGRTRLFGFEPQPHFEDVEGSPPPDTAKKVIPAALIIPQAQTEPSQRIKSINDKILEWLKANSIEPESLQEKSSRTTRSEDHSLLAALLRALDESELKRVQMPLDVVAKLSRV